MLRGVVGTVDLFTVLGLTPALGRVFVQGEDRAGSAGVVVLGNELWRSRFGGEPSVLGRSIDLNGTPKTIIGVLAPGVAFPVNRSEFWMPTVIDSTVDDYQAGYLLLVGRLKSGVSLARARDDIARVIATLRADKIGDFSAEDATSFTVTPLHDLLVGPLGKRLVLLFGAVAFILPIACVNVANLFLVRSASRGRELAVRVAMGAGLGRLARQAVTESMLLSVTGALVGVLIAYPLSGAISAMLPSDVIGVEAIRLDGPVLAFAAALAVVIGITFGFVSAIRGASDRTLTVLRGGQTTLAKSGNGTMHALVIGEFALAFVLAIGAALTVQSFWRLPIGIRSLSSKGVQRIRKAIGPTWTGASRPTDIFAR